MQYCVNFQFRETTVKNRVVPSFVKFLNLLLFESNISFTSSPQLRHDFKKQEDEITGPVD